MRYLPHGEFDHRLAKLDLIAGLQFCPARIAMDFLTEAVADDPETAIPLRLAHGFVPAVVIEPVLSAGFVMDDVRMLARDGAVDFVVFGEGEIVPPRRAVQAGNVDGPADIGSCLLQQDFRLAGGSSHDD